MDENQLKAARKEWGHAMDIERRNNRIYVANDGWISDNPADARKGKHFGTHKGLIFYSKNRATTGCIINVINSIAQEATV